MTLDELLKDQKLGEVKVMLHGYHYEWFQPFFKTKNGFYCGLNEAGVSDTWSGGSCGWSIWQEPKKKVKRWLWCNQHGEISSTMYSAEETSIFGAICESFPIKLLWSETEVDE